MTRSSEHLPFRPISGGSYRCLRPSATPYWQTRHSKLGFGTALGTDCTKKNSFSPNTRWYQVIPHRSPSNSPNFTLRQPSCSYFGTRLKATLSAASSQSSAPFWLHTNWNTVGVSSCGWLLINPGILKTLTSLDLAPGWGLFQGPHHTCDLRFRLVFGRYCQDSVTGNVWKEASLHLGPDHIKFQKTLTCIDRNLLVRQLQKSILVISSNLTTGTSPSSFRVKVVEKDPSLSRILKLCTLYFFYNMFFRFSCGHDMLFGTPATLNMSRKRSSS